MTGGKGAVLSSEHTYPPFLPEFDLRNFGQAFAENSEDFEKRPSGIPGKTSIFIGSDAKDDALR